MILGLLLVLSIWAQPGTGVPPRLMATFLDLVTPLESPRAGWGGWLPSLARALGGSCSTPGCRWVLGDPPAPPPRPPALSPSRWLLLAQLLRPGGDPLLAPDGSSVALGPLLAGIEVGLRLGGGTPLPTPTPGPPPVDPLLAATISEPLAASSLAARGDGGRVPLGPGGCWDHPENPQNYTLTGPPSPLPDSVANGAMDGVLLGTHLARGPANLPQLLGSYYGTSEENVTGPPPSSRRRRDFGALVTPEKLEEEVVAMLGVLRVLPPTRELLEDVGAEEVATIARRAARDFTQTYVECPAIVPRCMWGARPYRGTPTLLTLPLANVFIHHTFIPSVPCRSFSSCSRALRQVQTFHQETRGWDDIGYSFLVGSDGYLYQGRGWHWVGAHTKGHNSRGFGLGYLGDFSATLPDPDVLSLVRDKLLPCAVSTGKLHPNYTLRGHRQMGNTDCPGDALFQEIRTWQGFE